MQTQGNNIEISVNGITICYDDFGTGNIPIIFIHGFPLDKTSWNPQMDFLQKTHRVIAYDIRGYGKSTLGTEPLSMTLFADDLIKFMDSLQIDKAIVCGLSMGGYILLNAVNRYAERFEAIVLCDTQCIADSAEVKEKRNKNIEMIESGGITDFAEGFIQNVFCKESLLNKKAIVITTKNIILSISTKTIAATLAALANRWEMCSSLNEIEVPTLILCGTEDTVTIPAQSELLNRNISNSTLLLIDKAGHMSNLEQPLEFNQHISNFITGLKK